MKLRNTILATLAAAAAACGGGAGIAGSARTEPGEPHRLDPGGVANVRVLCGLVGGSLIAAPVHDH